MKPFAIRPLLFLLCFFMKFAWINAQTRLDPGDLAIIQVNANNNLCSGVAADRISFICFKDITAGTTIDITDNGSIFKGQYYLRRKFYTTSNFGILKK